MSKYLTFNNISCCKLDFVRYFFSPSICAYVSEKTQAQFLYEQRHDPEKIAILNEIYIPGYEYMPKMASPRVIKTHFPFSLMPRSVMEVPAKVIYVARNPKDVAVSYYYQCRRARSIDYVNDFSLFWDYFERDLSNVHNAEIRVTDLLMGNFCIFFSYICTLHGTCKGRMGTSK